MKLVTAITFLQYCGAFPILYDEKIFASDRLDIKISWTFLCCTVVQFILSGWRLKNIFHVMIIAPSDLQLTMIITSQYLISNTAALLLSLKNIKYFCKCIQLGNEVMASSNSSQKLRTFCSLAFMNFCLQIGSALLIVKQFNHLICMFLGWHKSIFQQAVMSLAIFTSISIEVLVNYSILMVLKVTLDSYTKVNHRLSKLSDGKSDQDLTSKELEGLFKKHWKTGNLLIHLNRAFSLYIFIFGSTIFSKVTLLVYFLCVTNGIWNVKLGEHPKLSIALYLSLYSMTTLLFDFLILCVTSHQVNHKRNKTLVLLSRLLRKKSDRMTIKMNFQMHVFMYQIRSRQVELSGCDLFHVNRPLFYGDPEQVREVTRLRSELSKAANIR